MYVLKPALLLKVLAVGVLRNGIYRFIFDSLLIPLTFLLGLHLFLSRSLFCLSL